MQSSNFDELTKALAASTSRRHALRLIATASVGALLGLGGVSTAFAGHRRRSRTRSSPSRTPKPNKDCAHFCAAVFGANTPAANQCTSDAAHNKPNNLCQQCGGNAGSVCCTKSGGFCNGFVAGATCCPSGQHCDNGDCVADCTPNCPGNCGDNGCGGSCGTCSPGETCINGSCCSNACGSVCCGSGERCLADGCCPTDHFVCANTYCCSVGDLCTESGCCPQSRQCHGGCCPPGKTCLDVGNDAFCVRNIADCVCNNPGETHDCVDTCTGTASVCDDFCADKGGALVNSCHLSTLCP